jgi:hypothetical protein
VSSIPPEAIEMSTECATQIVRLAKFLTQSRRAIQYEREGQIDVPVSAGTPEGAFKVVDYFKLIARGHALMHERSDVTEEDIDMVAHIAISSIPGYLRPIVRTIRRNGKITSSECAEVCAVSQPTARKYLLEANLLEIGDLKKGIEAMNTADVLSLSDDFLWLKEP